MFLYGCLVVDLLHLDGCVCMCLFGCLIIHLEVLFYVMRLHGDQLSYYSYQQRFLC